MNWKYTERLKQINFLIKNKATGSPKEMAKKLGLSERAWFKVRDMLIYDLGLPIAYCTTKKTYYYTEEGSFEIGFKRISKDKSNDINGGHKIFFGHCTFSSVSAFSFESPFNIGRRY